ncbi:ankyrin repeat protein, putative [Trichomonas vaginalis G3]|uniref:Ankyrin repeat protein, putative n=1 Tax=Trichomonas vaginalis (strain ATCC PRA-98 / G3) TaxID=412133 RepID=A2EXE0_TRIV3|nr:protein ubiquitination [Trichomonas vaginalis G3]EAY02689.1 ankyrin repeat protein, putative [Trichomonas vaginalis G3]KAI5507598.1 protein ubiquitination [Trichomonas vaginalis G3]|eukprot:XP_001314912.1 ankyrin repeat protein [Trichomonas vaginalis G3]
MSVDYDYFPQHVDEWCNDGNFINCRTPMQISNILDKCSLTSKQFTQLFSLIQEFYNIEDTLKIMQHVHFSTKNDLKESCSVINCISELFNIPFLKEISSDITYIHKFDLRRATQKTKEPQKVPTTDANIKLLNSIDKLMDNFLIIYKVLVKAANEDDEYTIKYAVDEKYSDVRGNKLFIDQLFYAVFNKNHKLANLLIKYGASVTTRSKDNDSLLHLYALYDDVDGIRICLKYIDVNTQDGMGNTPLHYCISPGSVKALNFLLSQPGINPNIKNSVGSSPLSMAIKMEKDEITEILMDNPKVDTNI